MWWMLDNTFHFIYTLFHDSNAKNRNGLTLVAFVALGVRFERIFCAFGTQVFSKNSENRVLHKHMTFDCRTGESLYHIIISLIPQVLKNQHQQLRYIVFKTFLKSDVFSQAALHEHSLCKQML